MTYAEEFALHCAWMVPACFAIGYGMAAVRDWRTRVALMALAAVTMAGPVFAMGEDE